MTGKHWTDAELFSLEAMWGQQSVRSIAVTLGRSICAVVTKAQHQMLSCRPEESESVNAAAKRCGLPPPAMRRLLDSRGVEGVKQGRGRRARYLVTDVDAAMAWYLSTETVRAAAARLGVDDKHLRRRLRLLGLKATGRGSPLRVTEVQLQTANALARQGKPKMLPRTVAAAAPQCRWCLVALRARHPQDCRACNRRQKPCIGCDGPVGRYVAPDELECKECTMVWSPKTQAKRREVAHAAV